MAKVSQVFQDTFQTNVFQKAWGYVVFDRNVFQPNVFDVVQAIVKLVNESYGITESKETARGARQYNPSLKRRSDQGLNVMSTIDQDIMRAAGKGA